MVRIDKFDLTELKGKKLHKALVSYVEPEFNILILIFDDGSLVEVFGIDTSEVLGISFIDMNRYWVLQDSLFEYKKFKMFYSKTIEQVRVIGEDWNGHGIEISFGDLIDKTLLVQSIYAGKNPKGWNDCIRLGIGEYSYTFESYLSKSKIRDEINEWDPIGLFPHAPDDEYSTEINEILAESIGITEVNDLAQIIYQVFQKCFGDDVFCRTVEQCQEVASRILEVNINK